jgi:hypothetical protein
MKPTRASFLLLFLLSSLAGADEGSNEVDTTLGLYRARSGYHAGFFLGLGGLGVGYGRRLNDWLEAFTRFQVEVYSDNGQNPGGAVISAWFGPAINFPSSSGWQNSFFFAGGVGFNYSRIDAFTFPNTLFSTGAVSAWSVSYGVEAGKRFSLLPNVSWKPTISVSGFTGPDIFNNGFASHPTFAVIPLEFTALF